MKKHLQIFYFVITPKDAYLLYVLELVEIPSIEFAPVDVEEIRTSSTKD